MHNALFAFEVVIELSLPGAGGVDDFVRAGGAHPLLVEQVQRGLDNSKSGIRVARLKGLHALRDCTS